MSTYALLGTGMALTANTQITTLVDAEVGDLVLIFGEGNAQITASAISDNAAGGSNTYTPSIGTATAAVVICGYRSSSVLTKRLPAGSVITVDNSGGKGRQAHVAVVVKSPAASPLDKQVQATGNSASPSPGASGVLAQADEFVFVSVNAIQTADPGLAGYTKVGSIATNGGTNDRVCIVYVKTVTATTTQTPVASIAASGNWSAQMVTVKTAATVTPPSSSAKVWNGTTELAATLSVWDGANEIPLTIA